MPEYNRVLGTRERSAQFEAKLLATAKLIDAGLGKDTMLPPDALQLLVTRMANRIAAWEHSPKRQRERQRKQATSRQRGNRGRDLQIVRAIENGDSQRKVAKQWGISRGAVEHVLERDAPHLLNRRKKHKPPPD